MNTDQVKNLLTRLGADKVSLPLIWSTKMMIIFCIISFVAGVAFGAYIQSHWGPKLTNDVQTKEIVTLPPTVIQGDTKTIHQIEYVEKATDLQTGLKEKTDVQINSKPIEEINVDVNGKAFTVKPTIAEDYKFQNGKIVYTQDSAFHLKVDTPPPIKIPPAGISLGTYIGKHSGGVTIDVGKAGVSIGPEWKDPKEIDYQVRWNFLKK